ncbi:uncharacterized protein LOC142605926 [Castanea sativa]|uniref:uncharacterized protein LOC142605926 n=1 Tax=Castanea sativa TaxID=21020 RepID=UPI003F653ED4
MSSTYHPHFDGQNEMVNRSLEQYLRAFVGDKPHTWDAWLYWAKFWFNTNYHSSTKMTPFEALYGISSPKVLDYVPNTAQAVNTMLKDRTVLLTLLKQNLIAAQARLKAQADQYKSDKTFQKLGQVAYKLALPPGFSIHSVFHVSSLKANLGTHISPIPTLPPLDSEGFLNSGPIVIL